MRPRTRRTRLASSLRRRTRCPFDKGRRRACRRPPRTLFGRSPQSPHRSGNRSGSSSPTSSWVDSAQSIGRSELGTGLALGATVAESGGRGTGTSGVGAGASAVGGGGAALGTGWGRDVGGDAGFVEEVAD